MAEENDLTDAMGALSVDDNHWKELGLDDNIRTQLRKIENDYESIFSWNIKRLTGANQNLTTNLVNNIRGRLEIITVMDGNDDKFKLTRFYSQLVVCYELYNSKSYKESYLEMESIVKFLDTCKFDELHEQYSNAYHHIARATYAYIALTLKIDSEKLLKDIKQIEEFNEAEKAAICAVKAKIFMEYPQKGNYIALEFSDQARALYPTEPEWINIWLKAKGRVRRYSEPFKIPGDDEISAAETLCLTTTHPKHFIKVYKLFKEVGWVSKFINNDKESTKFFKLSSDTIKKSIELADGDIYQLNILLQQTFMDCPYFFPKSILSNFITKLSSIKNSRVDQILGLYYLKHEKNFEKAKLHLSLGMAAGNFHSTLQLIKVECLLQPVNKFPYVQTLNTMYNDFQNPKRRLTILLHILMYFIYCEKNPKETMRYLKLYIDQDIEDTVKKTNLIFARPLFDVGRFLKPNEFLNDLSVNLTKIMNNNYLSREEKNTFIRLNKILQLNIQDNNFYKTAIHK